MFMRFRWLEYGRSWLVNNNMRLWVDFKAILISRVVCSSASVDILSCLAHIVLQWALLSTFSVMIFFNARRETDMELIS